MSQVQRVEGFSSRIVNGMVNGMVDDVATGMVDRIVERTVIDVEATISVANRPRPITLINISSHGFMGECRCGVPLNSRVVLVLPGLGPLSGCVRWSVGRRVGGRFDTPLDDEQLADASAAAFAKTPAAFA